MYIREDIRNIAIIAHVDHGKTTLVDGMLKQSGIFRENEHIQERVMDSNDLERERGITILSKNTAINYKGIKINIVDTPGHADFGGEVERVLKMVDSVLLVVDAFEGPMPQTKFVLKKALELNLRPIVVINKIDRPEQRSNEVVDEVFDLFIELGADDKQLDFPIVYVSAREGIAKLNMDDESDNLKPLFDMIIKNVAPPQGELDGPFQMLVTSIDANEYVGRIAIGKIVRGRLNAGMQIALISRDDGIKNVKVNTLYTFSGLKRIEVENAYLGDIVALSGIENINIGDTLADCDNPEALPFVDIDEPTISMTFSVNNSPFAGTEGTYVTSRHLRDRLFKELETNLSMRIEETGSPDSYKVSGRGELHLSILIETMRREGYEMQVSKPMVIYKTIGGKRYEPIEFLTIDVSESFMGIVMEKLGPRKAEMINMHSAVNGYVRMEFKIPARGLIGFRNEFLTDTKGNGIMNHIFSGFEEYKGDIQQRSRGSLIAFETGESVAYGLFNAQGRGNLFIGPGVKVYSGMVIGENQRADDMEVNICKKKHVSNMRSSSADESLKLTPAINLSLEQSIEFAADDEIVEITPKSIRIRKKLLSSELRSKDSSRKRALAEKSE